MERSEIRSILKELIEETTGEPCAELQDDQDLRGVGLDSVDLFSLVIETQSRFGIKIATDELQGVASVGDFLGIVEAKIGGASKGHIEAA